MPAPLRQACERTPSWEALSPSVPLPRPTLSPRVSSGSPTSLKTRQRISPLQRTRSRNEKVISKSWAENEADEKECSGNAVLRTGQARGARQRGRSKNHHDARQRAKSMIRPPQSSEEDRHCFVCSVCQASSGEMAPGKCPNPVCNNAVMDCDCSADFYPGNIPIPLLSSPAEGQGILRGRTWRRRGQEDPRCRRTRSEVRLGVRCEFKENSNEHNSFIMGRGRTSAFHEKSYIRGAAPGAIAAYSEPKNHRSSALDQNTEDDDGRGGGKRGSRRTYRNRGRPLRDRPKSQTRFPESNGVLAVWAGKSGVRLPM